VVKLQWGGTRAVSTIGMSLPDHPEWWVDAELELRDGALIVRSVRLQPYGTAARPDGAMIGPTPEGGMTAEVLRSVPLAKLRNMLLEHPRAREMLSATYGSEHVAALEAARRPGRAGRDDVFYAGWAAEYVDAGSSKPNAKLAERHGLDVATIREFVHEARRRDLLTKGVPGKAGGALTPKAKKLLAQQQSKGGTR
jgi:hypothetical protein